MVKLTEITELEHAAELVTREASTLLGYARRELENIDAARALGDPPAERLAELRLARIARRLTRAQAVLVHEDEPRAKAAAAVIGYCNEADAKDRPWSEPLPTLTLGLAS